MRRRGRRGRYAGLALTAIALLVAAALLAAPVSADVPILSGPGSTTLEATGPGGASFTFAVTSNDPTAIPSCDHASGETFPLGPPTTVTCTATNAGGETGTLSFTITVQDTTKPTVSTPGDLTREAGSASGATVNFSASASDAVDGSITPSCSPGSGSTFGFGTTTVTCTATDSHGNTGSATFHVTVQDTTRPSVSVPSDRSESTTNPGGLVVTYTASASDTVDGPITPSCSPASGATFAIGTTTVTCTATDAHGNTGSASFHVTVTLVDTTPPVVTVPADITTTTTVASGKTVTFSASANDNIDGSITPSCSPASGSNFPVGTTTVTCTATDTHGNTGSKSFQITVTLVDTTPPVVTVPADITTTTPVNAGKVVTFSASANDNIDGPRPTTCNPASGATFPIGTTTVTCTATDTHGNSGSASFHVTVTLVDTTPPVVTVPADITTTTPVNAGKVVTFSASANDNIDGPRPTTCNPASGATFPIGTTTVTCTATDTHGNSGSASFHVTVTLVDTTPPVVTAPANITTEATSAAGAVVTFSASAHDNIDGDLVATCVPPSGSTFPIQNTLITCSATDAHGNTGTDTFHVIVQDTTKPTVSVPADMTVDATSAAGALVTFTVSASDNVDGAISATCTPASGATFAIATTNVTCTATDAHGNKGSASFNVTVRDAAGPVVNVPLKTVVEATGTHGAIVTFTVSATDLIDGPIAPPIPCTPASGSTFALGTTKVTCTAHDAAGNIGTGTFDVVVQDTTAPRLNVPAKITLSSPDGGPLPRTQSSIAAFLASPQADDLVDGHDLVTNNAPDSFPLGTTTITFTTHDAAKNTVSATSSITVVYTPAAPPLVPLPPDTTPPPDPTHVAAAAGNRKIVISWQAPAAADLDHYLVEQSLPETAPVLVYTGSGTTYTAASLTNGLQYRFVVVSVDRAGNKSTGAIVTATPAAPMLLRPADGAIVATLPVLVWVAIPTATYYNVQLYRMPSLSAVGGRKILSAWPTAVSLRLTQKWRYNGASYQLTPGVYRWFVWPGLGPRANGKYGQLLGSSAFVIRRAPTPPAKPKPKPKKKP